MINEQAYFAATTLQFIQKARVAAQVRETHLEKNGKSCDLTKQVVERAGEFEEWLNEEIEDETPDAIIPTDQKGAKYLYLPNPRELGTNVLHLQLMAALFYAFGESIIRLPTGILGVKQIPVPFLEILLKKVLIFGGLVLTIFLTSLLV